MRLDRDALRWMPAGALTALAVLSIFSIGIFLAPLVALLTLWASRATDGRGTYGTLVGAGLLVAGLCLPQAAFRGIGLAGLALLGAGVVLCLGSHRAAPGR